MIKHFKNRATEQFFKGKQVKKFESFRQQAERRLQIIDSAASLDDLRNLPSNRFESLRGDRKGQYSISINQKWRICFKWEAPDVLDVEIVDYH